MKDISDIETLNRDEMVCPHCRQQSLTQHPAADRQSGEQKKILYGTQCENPECPSSGLIDANKLETQLPDRSLYDFVSTPSGISPATFLLVLGGIFVIAYLFGIVGIGSVVGGDYAIAGSATGPDGEPLDGSVIVDGNAQQLEGGSFSVEGLSEGAHEVYIDPEESSYGASPVVTVSVSDDGIELQDETEAVSIENSSLQFTVSGLHEITVSGYTAGGETTLVYNSRKNAEGTYVLLDGSDVGNNLVQKSSHVSTGSSSLQIRSAPKDTDARLVVPRTETDEQHQFVYGGDEETFTVPGTESPANVRLAFPTGDADEDTREEVSSASESATGADGGERNRIKLGTADAPGEYVITTDFTVDQNSEYVVAGYSINGDEIISVDEGSQTHTVRLDEGDDVYIWVDASAEEINEDKDYNGDGSDIVDVVDFTVNEQNDELSVDATVENHGGEADNIDIQVFVNGRQVVSKDVAVRAGERKTVEKVASGISFDEKGVHTISVNQHDPVIILVDGAEIEYGAGSIDATLNRQSGGIESYADVEVNGQTACAEEDFESGTLGQCSIPGGLLSPGENIIEMGDDLVGQEATLSYTARGVADEVTITINGESQTFQRSEVSGSSDSGPWETNFDPRGLTRGSNTVQVSTESVHGMTLEATAELEYTVEASEPSNPVVKVTNANDGEFEKAVPESELTDDGRLTTDYVVDIPDEWLTRGENTIRVETDTGVVFAEVVSQSTVEQSPEWRDD